jgi:hypothetical protein
MTRVARAAQCDLDELLAARELIVVIGEGELRGSAAAAALFAGWCVLHPDATIVLDTPAAWAGAAWRIGDGAYALWLSGVTEFDAQTALNEGLCDAIGSDFDLGARSELALDSAAALVQRRGGDALERAEFARLFAAGEPQKGLRAFLEKRTPRF